MKLQTTILLIFVFGILNLKSQSHYICSSAKIYTVNPSTCADTLLCNSIPYTFNSNTSTSSLDDIAFDANNDLYAITTTNRHLILVNPATCTGTYIIAFPTNVNSLVGAANGKLYAASNVLYEVDLTIPSVTNLGTLPSTSAGDLAFLNGDLYMTCQNGDLLLVDINVPANSTNLGNLGVNGNWYGMWTDYSGCNNSQIYISNEDDIYTLNLSPLSTTFNCSLGWSTWVWIGGATSNGDYLASGCNTVPSNVHASFTPSNTTICEGDSITFTDNSTGNNIFGWNWTFNGGNPPSANTQGPHTVVFNTAGNYNIVLQVTDSSGTDDSTIAITVSPSEDATFNYSAASYCQTEPNQTPTITGTVGGNFTSTPAGLSINPTTGIINVGASTPGTYGILYTTPGPTCQDTLTVFVTVTTTEDATFNYSAASYCQNDPNQNPTITGTTGGTFTSSPAGLSINPTTGIINISTSTPGTYGVLYTTPSASCQDTLTVFVTVSPSEDATFNYSAASYCLTEPNQTPTITGTTGGNFTSAPAGLSINPTTGVINVGASTPGTYGVLYTTPGPTCQDTLTVFVTITTSEDATFNYSAASYCQNNPDPTANITGTLGGTFTSSPAGLNFNATTGLINLAASTPGTYGILYTTPSTSCQDTLTVFITINPADDATFNYSAATYCISDPNPSAAITGTPGGTFTINNGGVINPTTGEININGSGAGTFNITYTTNGTCPDTLTLSITISNAQDATITAAGPFCSADNAINLIAVNSGGLWSGTGITNTTNGTFNPATAGAGIHQIIYSITGNCGDADTINILVSDAPVATLTTVDDNCYNEEGSITSSITGGTPTYTYSWNNGFNTPDIANLPAGTYTLTVTDSAGCSYTKIAIINDNTIDCDYHIFLPNIFSPNGDGNNDLFIVRGKGIESVNLVVYSRWGEKVFETSDKDIGWNGEFKGEKLNSAVFVYYLNATMINGEKINKQGNVTLVR